MNPVCYFPNPSPAGLFHGYDISTLDPTPYFLSNAPRCRPWRARLPPPGSRRCQDAERRALYLRAKIGINMHLSNQPSETGNVRMYEVPAHVAMPLSDKAALDVRGAYRHRACRIPAHPS